MILALWHWLIDMTTVNQSVHGEARAAYDVQGDTLAIYLLLL